jgi:hypothetical protein
MFFSRTPQKKFFPYFRSMNDVASRNRFTDYEGTTHFILGSRGGIRGVAKKRTFFFQRDFT